MLLFPADHILFALCALCIIWVLTSVYSTFSTYLRQRKLIDRLPGRKGWPIIGHIHEFVGLDTPEIFHALLTFWEIKEPLTHGWSFLRPYVFAYHAPAAEAILSSNKLISKSNDYSFLRPWLGNGLLLNTGSSWHSRRRLLTPTFHFKILENFMPVFNEQSRVLVQQTKLQAREPNNNGQVNLFKLIAMCTLDIICETAMGRKIQAQIKETEYVRAIAQLTLLVQQRQIRTWLHRDFIYHLTADGKRSQKLVSILHELTQKVIQEKKMERQKRSTLQVTATDASTHGLYGPSHKNRLSFLDLLLEANGNELWGLTDKDVQAEVDTFMFEGHDTTSVAATWCLFLLGNSPEWQTRVQEEVDSIFQRNGGNITTNDLADMKLLEMCLKETLRLYPSVPFIGRHAEEDIEIAGFTVPKGSTVILSPYCLHRDPEVFPDPDTFNPENFLPNKITGRNPYAYVPFSAGPRNCIGQKFAMMEEKVILAHFLHNFSVQSLVSQKDMVLTADIILKPKYGIHVKVTERNV